MSYTKGEAEIQENYWSDSKEKVIMLPHSCDEWIIGNAQQAQILIDDLQELIKQLPAKPKDTE